MWGNTVLLQCGSAIHQSVINAFTVAWWRVSEVENPWSFQHLPLVLHPQSPLFFKCILLSLGVCFLMFNCTHTPSLCCTGILRFLASLRGLWSANKPKEKSVHWKEGSPCPQGAAGLERVYPESCQVLWKQHNNKNESGVKSRGGRVGSTPTPCC